METIRQNPRLRPKCQGSSQTLPNAPIHVIRKPAKATAVTGAHVDNTEVVPNEGYDTFFGLGMSFPNAKRAATTSKAIDSFSTQAAGSRAHHRQGRQDFSRARHNWRFNREESFMAYKKASTVDVIEGTGESPWSSTSKLRLYPTLPSHLYRVQLL